MKMPVGSGAWPAFWLMSKDHALGSAPASELDIVEGQGVATDVYFGSLHRDSSNQVFPDAQNRNNVMRVPARVNIEAGFHRYGALWDPNDPSITFYFDGQPIGHASKYDTTDGSPMMVILGNGIGNLIGSNVGSPPPPDVMQVDYVRVFQFSSQNPTPAIRQPVSSPDGGGQFPSGTGPSGSLTGGSASADADSGSGGTSGGDGGLAMSAVNETLTAGAAIATLAISHAIAEPLVSYSLEQPDPTAALILALLGAEPNAADLITNRGDIERCIAFDNELFVGIAHADYHHDFGYFAG
jgi:Glycosyl hydrolases family 16